MRVLFDTNVVLDVLLSREPWFQEGHLLWQYHDQGKIQAYVTATTLTDIFYISRRYTNPVGALEAVKTCLDTFSIIAVERSLLEEATRLPGHDFEDNLQLVCATSAGMDGIVTRNTDDFTHADIPIWSPHDALQHLNLS